MTLPPDYEPDTNTLSVRGSVLLFSDYIVFPIKAVKMLILKNIGYFHVCIHMYMCIDIVYKGADNYMVQNTPMMLRVHISLY